MRNQKESGFTLAEVLITLGVIGVVAAMTLPMLIQNYRKSIVENKLKTNYSIFYNALRMAESKYGETDGWQTCSEEVSFECNKNFFDNYLAPEIKLIRVCNDENNDACWKEPVSLGGIKGYLGKTSGVHAVSAIMANGTSLYMWAGAQNGKNPHWQIWMDLDGPHKGSNTIGADIFGMQINFKQSNTGKKGLFFPPSIFEKHNH